MARLPAIMTSRMDRASRLRKTIVLTDELKEALRQTQADEWGSLAGLTMIVRSSALEHNLSGVDSLKHAKVYELGSCRVNKVRGSLGCIQLRIEECSTGRLLVIKRSAGSRYWRLATDSLYSSESRIRRRYHGRGPRVDFGV